LTEKGRVLCRTIGNAAALALSMQFQEIRM
jgi:hypothetical protein